MTIFWGFVLLEYFAVTVSANNFYIIPNISGYTFLGFASSNKRETHKKGHSFKDFICPTLWSLKKITSRLETVMGVSFFSVNTPAILKQSGGNL